MNRGRAWKSLRVNWVLVRHHNKEHIDDIDLIGHITAMTPEAKFIIKDPAYKLPVRYKQRHDDCSSTRQLSERPWAWDWGVAKPPLTATVFAKDLIQWLCARLDMSTRRQKRED